MIEHHLQKEILHSLVVSPSARFADLRPKNIDGNLFTYHLQQLIKQGYVAKGDDGSYSLTPQGKSAGVNVKLTAKALLEQAHPILLLAVRDKDGTWLLRRRLAHPTYGKIGFIHGEPQADTSITDTARVIFERRTGLTADFAPAGSGYIRIFEGNALESFVSFTVLTSQIQHQEILERDETGENIWFGGDDFGSQDMLVSMADLVSQLNSSTGHFFVDLRYEA